MEADSALALAIPATKFSDLLSLPVRIDYITASK
jgi:hypothetical protein